MSDECPQCGEFGDVNDECILTGHDSLWIEWVCDNCGIYWEEVVEYGEGSA